MDCPKWKTTKITPEGLFSKSLRPKCGGTNAAEFPHGPDGQF